MKENIFGKQIWYNLIWIANLNWNKLFNRVQEADVCLIFWSVTITGVILKVERIKLDEFEFERDIFKR